MGLAVSVHPKVVFTLLVVSVGSLPSAETVKPYFIKRTVILLVDGKETGRASSVEGRASSGAIARFDDPRNGPAERNVVLSDGTKIKIRDGLRIKTTTPPTDRQPAPECAKGALGSETIHGVSANQVQRPDGMFWLAPSLGCVELRKIVNLPGTSGKPTNQNRSETESIELKEPPAKLFAVDGLEELTPSEFAVRVMKANSALDQTTIQRVKLQMKGLDEQYHRLHQSSKSIR